MSKRDSYIFYRSWWENFRNMPNELRLELYDRTMEYAFEANNSEISVIAEGIIGLIKPLIDKDRAKYEAICERNKINGSKGGRRKTQSKPNENPENPLGSLGSVSETQKKPKDNPEKPLNDIMINDNNIYNKPKGYENIDFSFVDDSFKEVFFRWLTYKKNKNQKYKDRDSLETLYKKLREHSNDNPEIAREVVEQSIANNWAGLFPLKEHSIGINTGVIPKEGYKW